METLKLLVIDDEPGIRSGVARILKTHKVSYPFMDEDYQFEILEAASGEEGMRIIEQEMPDILLLDNKLPGIQGIDVLQTIKEKKYDIMVAMITSYASLEVAVKATGYGANDFIPKPFTPQELKASVDNITKQLFLKRISRKLRKEGRKIRFQFLSVLSHELKAPLNAIEGYLMMMQERQGGNDIAAYDKTIEKCMNRIHGMRNLIMDCLDFTRVRFDKQKEKIKATDLVKVAKVCISTIQPYAIQKNVNIFLHADEAVIIEVDPEDFEIIFNNLLSNAVKYNIEDGRVDISLKVEEKNVRIIVTDSGIGIAEEDIPKLFREFVRLKNDKTRNISGSGLGLSIIKRIIEMYDGTIKIKSKPDEGSSFILKIPKNTRQRLEITTKEKTYDDQQASGKNS
jgi:two-component system, sensor histidine kinase and response regulator